MTKVHPTDTSRCALCDCRVCSTQHVGLYFVGTRAAIGYALCEACGKQARRGLPPDQLRKLNAKLEAVAVAHGLATTH